MAKQETITVVITGWTHEVIGFHRRYEDNSRTPDGMYTLSDYAAEMEMLAMRYVVMVEVKRDTESMTVFNKPVVDAHSPMQRRAAHKATKRGA
jgi:hypothetical protein